LHITKISKSTGINYSIFLNIPRATKKSTKRIDDIL
jgi:hypothetical protein